MAFVYLMFGAMTVAAFGSAFLLLFKLEMGKSAKKTGAPKPPTFEALSAPRKE